MNKDYRLTPARKNILELFSYSCKPMTAQQILSYLAKNKIFVNKTTIYRELDFLLKKDFIKELHISSGRRYYERTEQKHHHHLICKKCGTIEDVTLIQNLAKEEKRLELEKDFKITDHSLEFFGLCVNCQ
jgi:Fe2+ or Zn2+ uptake regulation protein